MISQQIYPQSLYTHNGPDSIYLIFIFVSQINIQEVLYALKLVISDFLMQKTKNLFLCKISLYKNFMGCRVSYFEQSRSKHLGGDTEIVLDEEKSDFVEFVEFLKLVWNLHSVWSQMSQRI